MRDDRDRRVESLFHELADLPSADRETFLQQHCADESLRAEVRRLLEFDERAGGGLTDHALPDADECIQIDLTEPIGPYQLLQRIGEGGMGVVYMAQQIEPVRRRVALKIIKPGMDTREVIARFEAERQALAMMDHPNIARVLDAGTTQHGRPYFVMELVKGLPITHYCDEHSLSTRDRLTLFATICRAVEHAHQKGIIHRDLKPSNILVAEYDDHAVPRIIDFGLAKALNQSLTEQTLFTQYGQIVGTLDYMSPEQAKFNQLEVDTRSDVYSLGVVLYELLTGTTPFDKQRLRSRGFDELIRIIGEEEPPRPSIRLSSSRELATVAANHRTDSRKLPGVMKGELDWIVMKALEKDRSRRYQSASTFAADVDRFLTDQPVHARPPSAGYRMSKFIRRHRVTLSRTLVATLTCVLAIVAVAFYLQSFRGRRQLLAQQTESTRQQQRIEEQWATEKKARLQQIPELRRLVSEKLYCEAFELAKVIEASVANDPTIADLRSEFAYPWQVRSHPEGADVYWRDYDDPEQAWRYAGRTPIDRVLLPKEMLLWKMTRRGFDDVVGCRHPSDQVVSFTLDKSEDRPPGMVRVFGNEFRDLFLASELSDLDLDDYYIDQCEVTNGEYEKFVDAGGYRNREFWEPIPKSGDANLTFEELMQRFVDETGQPGPATWRDGTYPQEEAELPVRGVSWYEASAYARFVGKQLPTVVHWARASGTSWHYASQVASLSNFAGSGPSTVGNFPGIGPFGTFDTAGNVREWCHNLTSDKQRAILGGCWADPSYQFGLWHQSEPLSRERHYGFRCVKYLAGETPSRALTTIELRAQRDLLSEQPFDDEIFEICRAHYAFRKTPFNPKVVSTAEFDDFSHQVVQIDTAYDQSRFDVHVLLPKNRAAPFQPVLFFPGSGVFNNEAPFPKDLSATEAGPWSYPSFLVKDGRAVIWPVYYGSFERSISADIYGNAQWLTRAVQDGLRTVDYIATREDLEMQRLAYLGQSLGVIVGPFITGIDPRFKAGIFYHGGLLDRISRVPQFDGLGFVHRIKFPVLMINGRNDGLFDVVTSQAPLFHFLGSSPEEKAWMIFDGGHGTDPRLWNPDAVAWLDLYLGPTHKKSEWHRLNAMASFAALRGQWSAAADAALRALEANEPGPAPDLQRGIEQMRAAILLLLADTPAGYRQLCERMKLELVDADTPHAWELLIKTCSLQVPPLSLPEDLTRQLAEALTDPELEDTFRSQATVTLALQGQRHGQPSRVLQLLEDLPPGQSNEALVATAHAITALAHFDLGQEQQALASLAAAAALIDEAVPRGDHGNLDSCYAMRTQTLRHDWLIAEWLRQEGERRSADRLDAAESKKPPS